MLAITCSIFTGCSSSSQPLHTEAVNTEGATTKEPVKTEAASTEAAPTKEPVKTEAASTEAVPTTKPVKTEASNDYSYLNGLWTTDHRSKDSIITNGGSYLELTVLDNNKIKGTLAAIQSGTQRITSITFTCPIKNNEIIYNYGEDDFFNSGTVVISFSKDEIDVSDCHALAESNTSGWGLQSGKF